MPLFDVSFVFIPYGRLTFFLDPFLWFSEKINGVMILFPLCAVLWIFGALKDV